MQRKLITKFHAFGKPLLTDLYPTGNHSRNKAVYDYGAICRIGDIDLL